MRGLDTHRMAIELPPRLRERGRDVLRDLRPHRVSLSVLGAIQLIVVCAGLGLVGLSSTGIDELATCTTPRCVSSSPAYAPAGAATDAGAATSEGEDPGATAAAEEAPATPEDGADAADAGGDRDEDDDAEPAGGVPDVPAMVEEAATREVAVPTREDVLPAASAESDEDLPLRRMPYAHYAEDAAGMIARLPTLDVLARYFPESAMTDDIEAQRARIRELDAEVEVTPEGYEDFTVDDSHQQAFADLPSYQEQITPRMFIVHWTAWGYDDVEHFITSLRPNRVQYFIDADARTYRLFEKDTHKPGHALGANEFAQGVEIETGTFDEQTSPLFSYTPRQIEHTVYLAVDFLRRNGLPVDETTLVGHYAVDLIFANPYYDPHEGTFSQERIRKYDPPEELMQVVVRKAEALDEALGDPA